MARRSILPATACAKPAVPDGRDAEAQPGEQEHREYGDQQLRQADVRADDRRPTRAQPATYTPAVAPEAKPPNVEAKLRFLAFASEITGKPIRSWGDALKVWKTSYDEPQTVDEWRAAASAFRAAVKPTQAGLAAEYEDIETTEKQLSNGAAGVAR